MSFAKIFQTIYDSSIADDWQTRIVFQDMLILAERNGVIDMTPSAIHRRTNLPLEMILAAIPKLEGPDISSRTAEKEGRRIERLDPHREWGWRIVNWERYRQSANKEMIRMVETERKRVYRAKFPPHPPEKKERDIEAEAEQSRQCPGQKRDELRAVVGPAIESALKWLANAKENGADYTESEMRSAFLALSAGGWKWGMRDIADWRCALERQIQTDRERKPYAKDQRSGGRSFDRNKGTCNEGKAAQYDLGRIQAAEPVQDAGS